MGRVTELLEQMLERQVAERGIVLWYDPQKVYATFAHNLELPKATVLRFSEGFFRLRQQLEPYLEYVMDDGTLKQVRRLLRSGLIEMTIPEKPNSRLQKYRLTVSGRSLLAGLGDGENG